MNEDQIRKELTKRGTYRATDEPLIKMYSKALKMAQATLERVEANLDQLDDFGKPLDVGPDLSRHKAFLDIIVKLGNQLGVGPLGRHKVKPSDPIQDPRKDPLAILDD